MAERIGWGTLRGLAGFRAEQGCALSLYLNLDSSETATGGDLATRINSLLDRAEKSSAATAEGLSREAREAIRGDLARIRRFFDEDFSRENTRGLAVFAAGLDGFWRTLALAQPVEEGISVGPDLWLAPLVPLAMGHDGALVVQVSREQGRVFRVRAGALEEVADLSESQPGQHHQGGWSQARYSRHIDRLVEEHLKTVADELAKRSRGGGAPKIVLVCSEDLRAGFMEALSSEARAAIVGRTNVEAHAGAPELYAAIEPVLEDSVAEEEAEVVERWREGAGTNGRASTGWAETLTAASDGRVEVLLYQLGAQKPAFQCPRCGRASAEAGECPLDGSGLEPRENGLDLAVHRTLALGGTVRPLRHRQDLDPVEGIGALLRF